MKSFTALLIGLTVVFATVASTPIAENNLDEAVLIRQIEEFSQHGDNKMEEEGVYF
jgi:hypothetical protein